MIMYSDFEGDRNYRKNNIPMSSVDDATLDQRSLLLYIQAQLESEAQEKRGEQIVALREAFKLLTQKQRVVLLLETAYGLSQSEIARRLDCTQAAVSQHRSAALQKLKNEIDK